MLPLLALGLPALAFAPSDSVHIGMEPTRIFKVHTDQQRRLRDAKAWTSFTDGEGAGWMARFDERTGLPFRAWGAGIELGALDSEQAVEGALRGFFDRHPGLTGVDTANLRLGRAAHDPDTDSWIVRFDQVLPADNRAVGDELERFEHFTSHGQPVVWQGRIEARIRYGKLVMVGFHTYPDAEGLDATPTLSAEDAWDIAVGQGPHPDAVHDIEGASLVVLPLDDGNRLSHRLAWMTRSETGEDRDYGDPRGIWVSFVDAHSGELLNVHNQVRYASQVFGTHDTRTVNGDFSTSPLVSLSLSGGDASDVTDDDGRTDLDGGISATLNGPHFRVRNAAGSNAAFSWGGGEFTLTDSDAHLAEIDTWVFMHEIREWSLDYAPGNALPDEKLDSTVNIDSSCNAYYDGDVNYYQADDYCNNTGRIRDVNHHEWGHGFHYYAAWSSYVDGSVGEGSGDVLAFLLSGDPITAPYFMRDGSGIRNHDNSNRYPEDFYEGEVHYNGQIFGGSFWDFWQIMKAEVGEEAAFAVTSDLFAKTLEQNPTVATAYDDALAADDDNGDLSDGTPNQCELIEAFSGHGLGPGGAGTGVVGVEMEGLDNQADDAAEYPVSADVLLFAEACVDASATGGEVTFSSDGGETWETAALSASGESLTGAIPQIEGDGTATIVEYYVQMDYDAGSSAGSAMVPTHGPIAPFTFVVGDMTELYCEDFEADDGGYTHELLAGTNAEGADDWMWARPRGASTDPDFAFSGEKVWGNDLGGGNFNGDYQADKHNRLQSPAIDVSAADGELVLQYRRWLNVEDSEFDQAMITAGDEVIWTNHTAGSRGDEHTADEQWAMHSVRIPASAVADDGTLTLGWEISSDGGLEMGGWNIDDVCVYTVESTASLGGDDGDSGEPEVGSPGVAPGAAPELTACACSTTDRAAGGGFMVLGLAGLALLRRREEDAMR